MHVEHITMMGSLHVNEIEEIEGIAGLLLAELASIFGPGDEEEDEGGDFDKAA